MLVLVVRVFHAAAFVQVDLAGLANEASVEAAAEEVACDVCADAAVRAGNVLALIDVDARRVRVPAQRSRVARRTGTLVRAHRVLTERWGAAVVLLLRALVNVMARLPVALL